MKIEELLTEEEIKALRATAKQPFTKKVVIDSWLDSIGAHTPVEKDPHGIPSAEED